MDYSEDDPFTDWVSNRPIAEADCWQCKGKCEVRQACELNDTTKVFRRSLADAFPDVRAYCIEGPRGSWLGRLLARFMARD